MCQKNNKLKFHTIGMVTLNKKDLPTNWNSVLDLRHKVYLLEYNIITSIKECQQIMHKFEGPHDIVMIKSSTSSNFFPIRSNGKLPQKCTITCILAPLKCRIVFECISHDRLEMTD